MHTEHEDHPWAVNIPNHPPRKDYVLTQKGRDLQPVLARLIAIFFRDIAMEAEELAGLKLTAVKPTNKTVH